MESWRIALMMSDMNATYPGFDRAVPRNAPPPYPPYMLTFVRPSMDDELDKVYTDEPRYESKRFYGNEFFHILSLDKVDGGWRAYVCDGLYKVFRDDRDGYSPVFTMRGWGGQPKEPMKEIRVWHVELSGSAEPGVPQKGSGPAPVGDVFAPWRIIGAAPDSMWESAPNLDRDYATHGFREFERRRQQCSDSMPDNPTVRKTYDHWADTRPPMEPAVPGWPDNAA